MPLLGNLYDMASMLLTPLCKKVIARLACKPWSARADCRVQYGTFYAVSTSTLATEPAGTGLGLEEDSGEAK